VVEVVKGSFALKGQFMKHVEHVECERCLRAVKCRGEPTSSHELGSFVDNTVGTTVAKVHRYVVDTRGVDDEEFWRSCLGRRAGCATVTKLDLKTKLLESGLFKKEAIPELVK
jgi:hypothetical protein